MPMASYTAAIRQVTAYRDFGAFDYLDTSILPSRQQRILATIQNWVVR